MPKPGDVKKNPNDDLNYVWIPPGAFQMGCPEAESPCYKDEQPAHPVTITKGFWMGQIEVTQAAYQKVTQKNPSHFRGPQLPVESVNWNEAKAYCGDMGGRLPTEAEWEYAARAGSTAARYGNLDDIAWYGGNSGKKTHEVGQKMPNAWKLHDMLGNVWEWVEDWYGENYYKRSPSEDPKGPESGTSRVLRGGSWYYPSLFLRAAGRDSLGPEGRNVYVGFRCVREVFP